MTRPKFPPPPWFNMRPLPSARHLTLMTAGLLALGLGGTFAVFSHGGNQWVFWSRVENQLISNNEPLSPEALQRRSDEELTRVANQQQPSVDRSRSRFILALRLQSQSPQEAIQWLAGLDTDYPQLAPQILALKAHLAQKVGHTPESQTLWQTILQTYPQDPVAAESLAALAKTDPTAQTRLFEQWPAHPLSVQAALEVLDKQPDNLPRLLQVAQYGYYTFKIDEVLDRLTTQHAAQLTPTDWEHIAFAYWEKIDFAQAAKAYGQAPPTALNLYRAGRSYHLMGETDKAIHFYRQLMQQFPQAQETALGLKHLATLERAADPRTALQLWQKLYETFPDRQALALVEKSRILEQLGSKTSAHQAAQSVLTQHSDTEAAAELRWTGLQLAMQQKKLPVIQATIATMQQDNPEAELTAKANFWVGHWLQAQGSTAQAKPYWSWVVAHQPQSYWAWRSAAKLGLPVGDFTTLWQQEPPVQPQVTNPPLIPLAGSSTFQELYRLGAFQAAWRLWQVEFKNRVQPTAAEQLTDGLVRVSIEDYLDGLFMLSNLADREGSDDRSFYAKLHQDPAYWQSLYPLAFGDAVKTWSLDRHLNPVLVMGLMRQESRFMPGIVSGAGAVGLMQVMPDTAQWIAGKAAMGKYDLKDPSDNIKLGTWYLNYTHETWRGNSLLAVASYNAGPGNVEDWVNRLGLKDPDRFVEQIPFEETQNYVESVFANYWNYLRLYDPQVSQLLQSFRPADPAR